MARLRVVFDANYSRTRRLERSLIHNPENPQSPKLPLSKILQIFPKLLKKVVANENFGELTQNDRKIKAKMTISLSHCE